LTEELNADVVALLRDALDGDATRIEQLRKASQEQLHSAGHALGGALTFGRPAVLRVLHDWRAGRVNDEQVRWWALLMFVGAFPDEWSPYGWRFHAARKGQPIYVDYSDDEQVNEVVNELKDVGDFDDEGRIRREVDNMIASLSG
jgi:hypothetical protein